jgi:hypothetical protein
MSTTSMELRKFAEGSSTLVFEFWRGYFEIERLFFIGFLTITFVIFFSKTWGF